MKKEGNKYNRIIGIAVLLFVSFFVFCCGTNTPRDYPEIKESNVLHVVMECSPSGFFRSGDSIIGGQQYEMVMSLSEYLNIPVKIHTETGLKASLEGLESGKENMISPPVWFLLLPN